MWLTKKATSQHFFACSVSVVKDAADLSVFTKLPSWGHCDTSLAFLLPRLCSSYQVSLALVLGSTPQSLCPPPLSISSVSMVPQQHLLSRSVSWVPDSHIPPLGVHLHAGDPQATNGLTCLPPSPSGKTTPMGLGPCPMVAPKSVTRSCPSGLPDVSGFLLSIFTVITVVWMVPSPPYRTPCLCSLPPPSCRSELSTVYFGSWCTLFKMFHGSLCL